MSEEQFCEAVNLGFKEVHAIIRWQISLSLVLTFFPPAGSAADCVSQ